MKRVLGTLAALAGIVTAPPLWSEMTGGGLGPAILFAGAIACIGAGLAVSVKGRPGAGGG